MAYRVTICRRNLSTFSSIVDQTQKLHECTSIQTIMKNKITHFVIVFCLLLQHSLFSKANKCSPLIAHLKLQDNIPDNIVLLETHLARLNAEVRRFDSRQGDKKLSPAERSEIKLEENNLKTNNEQTLRELYLKRIGFFIPKIIEKLADLYIRHHHKEYTKAGINVESTREDLYSILLKTNIRDFSVESLRAITRLKKLLISQNNDLQNIGNIRQHISQLQMVIDKSDHLYAVTCLERCVSLVESKKIPKTKFQILEMAADVLKKLNEIKQNIYTVMSKRNNEILDALALFPHFEHSFEPSGFEAFVSEIPSRAYLDALWPLVNSFQKDKFRIIGCCGRMCGFNCPYLLGADVPTPSSRVKTHEPILSLYQAMKDFRKYVPPSSLAYPENRREFREQLDAIKNSVP